MHSLELDMFCQLIRYYDGDIQSCKHLFYIASTAVFTTIDYDSIHKLILLVLSFSRIFQFEIVANNREAMINNTLLNV